MEFVVRVEGVDSTRRWFRSRSGRLIRIVTPAFVNAGELVRRELLRGYDRPSTASAYRRTGTYGRKMQIRRRNRIDSVWVNVYNLTPYAKWVGVQKTQSPVHHGRWPTDVEVLKKLAPDIVEEVSGALIRGLR